MRTVPNGARRQARGHHQGRARVSFGERGGNGTRATLEVASVDTTGAGDAFIGSFAVFLGEGHPEKEALRRASLYAALSTTKVGTQKSFWNRAEFEKEWQKRCARV